jgi:hypothetical protein
MALLGVGTGTQGDEAKRRVWLGAGMLVGGWAAVGR